MSVESEILRIQHNIANAYATVAEKGGEVPLQATSSNLAAAVASIQTGVTQEELNEALTATQPKLTGQPGQVVGFAADGTAVAVPGWSNPNLLLNWDFRNPVNRNGKTEYTGTGYTIDRFKIGYSAGSTFTCGVEDNGVSLTAIPKEGETSQFNFYQIIPANLLNQGTYTLSFLYSSDCAVRPFAYSKKIGSVIPGYKDFPASNDPAIAVIPIKITSEMQGGDVIAYLQINTFVEAHVKLYAAKLELGTQQTLARQNEDGEWEIIDPPDYDLQYALCSLYSPSTGEWVGYQHSNPNLLDNWYFVDPVNQRGQTEYTSAGYAIDRWKLSNGKLTLSTTGATALLINTDSAYRRNVLFQLIERCSNFVGKTLTFSVLVTDLNGKMTASVYENGSKSTYNGNGILSDGLSTVTFTIPATAAPTEFRVHFLLSASGSCRPIAAKLELGAQQTLAHQDADGNWVLNDPPPDYQKELEKCQYYYKPKNDNWISACVMGNGYVQLRIPGRMRIVPAVEDTIPIFGTDEQWHPPTPLISKFLFPDSVVLNYYDPTLIGSAFNRGDCVLLSYQPALNADL